MLIKEDKLLEALGILQEECAEVIKEVSKIRRSGKDFKPFGGEASNYDNLRGEVQDVLSILTIIGMDSLSGKHFEMKRAKLTAWSTLFDEPVTEADKD
jgi:NTP pyrophosphatase (non-canonical NTP hydrolase)